MPIRRAVALFVVDLPILDDPARLAGRELTARGYHRVLRVARTLADLEGAATVARIHVAEALSYRRITLARCYRITGQD